MNFDYQILKLINDLAGKNQYLDWLGIFAAKYLIFLMVIALVLGLLIKRWPDYRLAIIKAFISGAFAYVINYLIGFIYFRPRPFVLNEVTKLIDKSPLEKSFPSDHTAVAFALAFSLYFYNKKLGSVLLFLAFIVSLGRIYVGVHYPLDILGGVLVGFLSAFLIERLVNKK
jgi:undecaprenyl-diphosphatase